jgi:uncharacterized protein (TIGR03790 family)
LLAVAAAFARPAGAQDDLLRELTGEIAPEDEPIAAQEPPAGGLTAREVVVVANENFPGSVDLARHYMDLRGVPPKQLLVAPMSSIEMISRNEYTGQIADPLRQFLTEGGMDHVRCVVLMHGVPLKVLEPISSPDVRRMTQMIASERQFQLATVIELLGQVRGLGKPPGGEPPGPPLEIDPARPAREQIRAMRDTVFGAFEQAAGELAAVDLPEVRERLAARWRELWNKAFGALPPPQDIFGQAAESAEMRQHRLATLMRVRDLLAGEITVDSMRELFSQTAEARGAVGVLEISSGLERRVKPDITWRAAVDSELATLFWPPFALDRYVPNPLHMDEHSGPSERTLMVCRLDGPNQPVVRRMMDIGIAVERLGLTGTAYVDARGRNGSGPYDDYDQDLVRLAELLEQRTKIKIVLDRREQLFQPGDCPEAGLYVGWYSLGRYVNAFDFAPGAVGFHIASSEAVSLRGRDNLRWCAQLLEHGVVATLGPVEEPYLTAFPRATDFFGLLLTGKYTLVECYYLTIPHVSWMMTLIGDPLYNPFRAHPALAAPGEREAPAE